MFLTHVKPDCIEFFSFPVMYEGTRYFAAFPLTGEGYEYAKEQQWVIPSKPIRIPSLDSYSYAVLFQHDVYSLYLEEEGKLILMRQIKDIPELLRTLQSLCFAVPVIVSLYVDVSSFLKDAVDRLQRLLKPVPFASPVFTASNPNRTDFSRYTVFAIARLTHSQILQCMNAFFAVSNSLQVVSKENEIISVIPKVALDGMFAVIQEEQCRTFNYFEIELSENVYILNVRR